MRSLLQDKKGVLGLSVVQGVVLGLMFLAILAVAATLIMTNLVTVMDNIDTTKVNILNVSTAEPVNETAVDITGTSTLRNCVATVTRVENYTGSAVITDGNYTVSGCTILFKSDDAQDASNYNDTKWNITGRYTYSTDTTINIERNATSGASAFFTNVPTIFSILIAVVIILAIAIIIAVVTRFGGTKASIGGSGAGFGSDTIAGV